MSLFWLIAIDPHESSATSRSTKPASLNMIDAPWFRARLRLPSGATITRAERILAFQTWLVAASSGKAKYVLASMKSNAVTGDEWGEKSSIRCYGELRSIDLGLG
jgi:hypothetical protein